MMKAFYDSLETLQKVQYATKKNYINLGLGVLVSVIVFGAFFVGIDTIGSGLYRGFYDMMRGSDYILEQQYNQDSTYVDEEETGTLLESVDLSDINNESLIQTVPEIADIEVTGSEE